MGLGNIVKSRGFKNFMAKLYGIGAAVVILGALFKINHYQGADIMLVIGLTTESIIFFFSAFEPPHVEPDWSLVYPELAGMYHGVDLELEEGTKKEGLTEDLDNMLAEAKIGPDLINSLGQGLHSLSESTNKLKDVSDASVAATEFTENMKSASASVGELSGLYSKQKDTINEEIVASEEFVGSVKSASQSAAGLSDTYKTTLDSLKADQNVTTGFSESLKAAMDTVNDLNKNYQKSSEKLIESADALDFSALKGNNYVEQLNKITQNLSALNSAYENQLQNSQSQSDSVNKLQETLEKFVGNLNTSISNTAKYDENLNTLNGVFQNQIQGASSQLESTQKLQSSLDGFLSKLNDSADKTLKYNEELDNLSKKVAALNKVYDNMLSAMNAKA